MGQKRHILNSVNSSICVGFSSDKHYPELKKVDITKTSLNAMDDKAVKVVY